MSDIRDFKLPDLGEGLTEGTIVAWEVAVGDVIALNQTVAQVETAKAVVEVPSPFAGTVVETIGAVGEELEVGSVFVRIQTGGAAAAPSAPVETESWAANAAPTDDLPKSVLDADEEPQPLVGYGSSGAGKSRRRRGGAAAEAVAEVAAPPAGKPLAKPPVRKLAKDLGVDLASVWPGSGPDGVITRADVEAAANGTTAPTAVIHATASAAAAAPVAAAAPAAAPAPRAAAPVLLTGSAGEKAVPGFRGRAPGDVEKVVGIRKRIIDKMSTSRREIPEATCSRTADLTELWELRKTLTAQAQEDGFDVKITPFAIILRATIMALRRFPTLNGVLDEAAGEIRLHEHINLGFAADTDKGLIVPNIKNAHTKSILQIAMELNELAAKGRDGKATAADLTGGTFTVSNYGAFGNDNGNPIINHPESGILGVGAIRERPWVVDGELAVRRVCEFSLAFDHRISDGGEAGRFVTYVADLCENPSKILLHS